MISSQGTPRIGCPAPRAMEGTRSPCVVEGMSMYNPDGDKSYSPGDIIFVDPDRPYRHGSMVVVRLDDEQKATFKRLLLEDGKMYLEALNPDWPDRIMEVTGPATICGVVFGKWVPE